MYESPIIQNIADISSQIREAQDGRLIYEVQQAIGYDINKEELIKALRYDRDQYQKGYEDGRKDNEWIPVSERLPEEGKDVLIQYKTNVGDYMAVSRIFDHNYWVDFGRDVCVIAWKPLPEPYKRG